VTSIGSETSNQVDEMLKWIIRIVPILAIILAITAFTILSSYPDLAIKKGGPWITLYRTLIGGRMRVSDQGYWISVSRHVERRIVTVTRGRRNSLKIHALRFRPKKVDFKVLHIPPEKNAEYSIVRAAEESDALAMINASFFDPAYKPLGLCVSNGQKISPMSPAQDYQGVFFVRKAKVDIEKRKKFKRYQGYNTTGFEQAVQSGPWLVLNGKPEFSYRNKKSVSRRSAVAIDDKGRVMFVVTDTYFSGILLADFAKILAASERDGGFNVENALNLDGGNSTQLLLRTPDESYMVRGFVNSPVYIGAFKKAS
jgi:uncharacterized protein YigE (DUF2233 family)